MDMLLLGETVIGAEGDTSYYGFWMPAGGNDGVAGAEVFLIGAGSAFTVYLQTKSSDSPDSGASDIGNVVLSSASPQSYKFDVTNAKDLVRYRVEPVRSEGATYVHLQFSQPMWAPN